MSSSNDNICIRCTVSGKVQGVFFRASTREQALQLNIKGYAKNLSDGNVEVIAVGHAKDVEKLKDWLYKGPRSAVVDKVMCEDVTDQQLDMMKINNFKVL